MDSYNSLIAKIQQRTARSVVVGLGYVGLPLAVLQAEAGFCVTGIERDPKRVALVNEGRSYIGDVIDDDLARVIGMGRLCATQEFSSISQADVVVICVQTPLDSNKRPDTSQIEGAIENAKPYRHPGQLFILESTTYPGTTEELLLPQLSGPHMQVGQDIFIAYAPERVDMGNKDFRVGNIPRLVGGVTPRCTEIARCFYQQVLRAPVYPVSSPKVAEMSKLVENVFREVNVSLINELAQLCERMGISVWEVIEAAKTKPFGFMPFYPGPGIGGHCIPVDPLYLSWKAGKYGFKTQFIDLASEINDNMQTYIADEIGQILERHGRPLKGSKIMVIGVAFKANVADTRESAALKVSEILLDRGCLLSYHDPYIPTVSVRGCQLDSIPITSSSLNACDMVVITTDHSAVDYSLIAQSSRLVYDTRNALKGLQGEHIYRLGAPKFS